MTVIMPPKTGEDVSILAPRSARLRGQVTGRENGSLTVELEQTPIRRPFRFAEGAEVAVEWVHELGVMQLSAMVTAAAPEPPTLRLEMVGAPEPIDRREHGRAAL